jgi:gamma-glutamylcyclotransferase (GGCT)/AIG2-like uncharacterized protein YtfP
MNEYLFLYGTLIPRQASREMATLVEQLRRVGSGSVNGRLYDLGKYPGAILDQSANTRISGEIFQLEDPDELLATLDSYEEFDPNDSKGSLFVRKRSLVSLADGRTLECWVYAYNRDPGTAPLVAGGDYQKYKAA